MKIGVMIHLRRDTDVEKEFEKARAMKLDSCQLSVWDMSVYSPETARAVREASEKTGIEVTTLWAGWSGPVEWNFTYGPLTAGLVPEAYRGIRQRDLMKGSDFAALIGVDRIATHVGFLPENYYDEGFRGTVAVLRRICRELKSRSQTFLFETGQETPVTALRAIEEIGLDNVGVNFDTANVMLYGKGNPADAVLVFGKYIRDTHIKDGFYPTNGRELGREVPAGEGLCDFDLIYSRLMDSGYDGPFTIEREISGEKQTEDIIKARKLLLDVEKRYRRKRRVNG